MEHLKFPIGKVDIPNEITNQHITNWIADIEQFPTKIQHLVQHLSEEQ